jgi:hypothetical protein
MVVGHGAFASPPALADERRRDAEQARPGRDPSTTIAVPMLNGPVYTVEEARALVPSVRAVLLQLAVERHAADTAHAALHGHLDADVPSPGMRRHLEAETAERRERVRILLAHLEQMGIVVRDLSTGLVDFPTNRGGEPAWLCWRLEDPDLAYWHTTREGYRSRRPL